MSTNKHENENLPKIIFGIFTAVVIKVLQNFS